MADEEDKDVRYGATDEDDLPAPFEQTEDRSTELMDEPGVARACVELYRDVEKAFSNQWERANSNMDYWDIYNCQLGPNQFYAGNSKIYAPICHDAVNARVTRFKNQLFPQSGKHVEVTASEESPHALVSLLEFYIRKCRLKTQILPPLLRNGDVEGQYSLYVGWTRNERHTAMRVHRGPTVDQALMVPDDDDMEDIVEETIVHQYPYVEVIADADIVIIPPNAPSVEGALDVGGSVTVIRRWSKAKIRQMIRDEEIDKEEGEFLLKTMSAKQSEQYPNKQKAMADAAGIKTEGGGKFAQVYETWTKLKIDGERRICRAYLGGETQVLSVKRNPYWCDKVPVLSAPQDRIEGSGKGISKLKFVDTLQYAANDAINEGMDAAAYALLPIIMTDPEKNPRVGSMVLNVAAVWQTSPNDTKFAQFPPLWKDAFTIVNAAKDQIFQTLSVNPSMIPQQTSGKKLNQAQIANEQQVDILTTADVVTGVEDEMMTPLLQWFVALDHQYRDRKITVRAFGKMGVEAEMEEIEPIQMDRRFEFRWFGVEQARNQQQLQQKMAGINVIRGIPPQLYAGYKLNLVPVITQFIEDLFGPRLTPQIFKNIREELTMEPQFENELLQSGYPLPVNPMDNDQQHLQVHMQAFQQLGDIHGTIREHMIHHQMQLQMKSQQAQQQALQQGAMGSPGAPGAPGGAGPGVAGTPRIGAAPAGARAQGPPGMIHQDRMPQGPPRIARG